MTSTDDAVELAMLDASVRLAELAHEATQAQARDHALSQAITAQGVALIYSCSSASKGEPSSYARIESLLRESIERLGRRASVDPEP